MKKSSNIMGIAIVVTAVFASVLCTYIDAQPRKSADGAVTLRMAQTSSEAGAIGQSMEVFAKEIYKATDGRYKVETFHNGQLGAEIDTIEGCQMGTIDIAVVNQSILGNFIDELAALDIPFLITSTEQADKVFLGDIGTYFLQRISGVQLRGLGIWESGFRNLTNSKVDVHARSDVAGLRIRTMENAIHQAFWREMGADPVPMSWGEAYTAMQQGAIDGQENPATVILTNNVAEVNKKMAITEHAYSTVFLVMSPITWAALNEEDQKIFTKVAYDCGIAERQLNRKMEAEAITKLRPAGVSITTVDKQEFVDAAAALVKGWTDQYGDIVTKIQALRTKG